MLLEPGLSPPTEAMLTMRPPSCSASVRGERPAEQVRPAQVRLVHAVPRVGVELVELAERDADVPRRVVDEDVAAAEVVDHAGGGGVDRRLVALVERDRRAPGDRGP